MKKRTFSLDEIIDIDRYPIHDASHTRCKDLIDYCHAELAEDGCCSIEKFFRESAVSRIADSINALTDQVFRPEATVGIYGGEEDESLPESHPRRVRNHRGGGFLGADLIDADSGLWTFFNSPVVTGFMMQAFEVQPLYQYADPIAGMAINCMWDGDAFPWHFDTNELTVSIQLQAPDDGGEFEYVPNIRTPEHEHYDEVKRVLAGERLKVRTLRLKPGDIQLFKGRYTLHRVCEVKGAKPRLVALPSWSSRPDQVGVIERMRHSYGRVLPIHYQRAGVSPDGLAQ